VLNLQVSYIAFLAFGFADAALAHRELAQQLILKERKR